MTNNLQFYKKAKSLDEIVNVVRFEMPISPDHEFYTDFSDVRGDFEDRMVYQSLNVNPKNFVFNREANQSNKVLLFLAGMRGSGKTSELAKIASKLNNKDCFFCVTCNLDEGLDLNDMEYMDILIFQIERLFEELKERKIKIDDDIIEDLQEWFSQRVEEVNKSIKRDGGFQIDIDAKTPSLFSFLNIAAKLKANLTGSKENSEKIRTVFKNNFTDFSRKFNSFVEAVNIHLRKKSIAQEILFIVDGLEKVSTHSIRKRIIIEENNRIRQIKVNTIFTLPIELMSEKQVLNTFSTVVSFPFVKIKEKNGAIIEKAIARFEEFVYKRIDASLFDSGDIVKKAILYAGGNPRELLRILKYVYINMRLDEDVDKISLSDLEKGIKKLAAENSQFLTEGDLEKLKILKDANDSNKPLPFGENWQRLLENNIVFEYNDGTYKRVYPVIEESELYKYYVG